MLKETITFQDLDGNDVTQDFYFGYSESELSIMELSTKGGLIAFANKITNEQDGEKVMKLIQDLILGAYGIKSADGIHFLKEDPIDHHKYADEFKQTDAYNQLFMKMLQDDAYITKFYNGIIPAKMRDQIEDMDKAEKLPGQKNYTGPELSTAMAQTISNAPKHN